MATKKITEQAQASEVKDAASLLVTQHETVDGETVEALRRASLANVITALKRNGILTGMQTEAGIQAMYSDMVKSVMSVSNGIRVTYWDDTYDDIEIESGGLAFDAVTYDQETGYLHITQDGEDVVDPCFIGGGGGGGVSGSVITITNRMPSRSFAITDSTTTCQILFAATSVDSETEEPTGNLTANWYVNGTRVSITNIAQGNGSFEVRNYLTNGATNTVKLVIEDTYGGSKSMNWTVTVTAYTMSWNIEDFSNHGTDSFNLRIVPNGQGDKIVKVTVDGTEIYSQVVATSGRAIAITVPAQSHGAHPLSEYGLSENEMSAVEALFDKLGAVPDYKVFGGDSQ